ncbi:MAG: exosortase/archaeosortase family protein [Candidatus Bathyarchaeia archaeon]
MRLSNLVKISFILSSTVSLITLYFLYLESYEVTWKGRAYYIFFLWLVFLEFILNWEKIDVKVHSLKSKRFSALIVVTLLPTIYVVIASFSGLNREIMNVFPKHYGMSVWAESMPLTIEYIILASLFLLIVILAYGRRGLRYLAPPISLLWAIGIIFIIDNLYPFGEFTLFQMLVPATSILASSILSLIGYNVELRGQIYGATALKVWSDKGEATFGITWPCSGVEGLILYSVITALFLSDSTLPRRLKILYFLIGAVITYIINALRIVMVFTIATKHGVTSPEVQRFHDYYGPLFSVMWILAYQLVIIAAQSLWSKRKSKDAIFGKSYK